MTSCVNIDRIQSGQKSKFHEIELERKAVQLSWRRMNGRYTTEFTVREDDRVFPSVQEAMLKRLLFHCDYQKLEEINCHNRSYPKSTQAISFIFLVREEFEKLLHVIIHTKRIGFPDWTDSSRLTDVIGARACVYVYSCMHLPLILCNGDSCLSRMNGVMFFKKKEKKKNCVVGVTLILGASHLRAFSFLVVVYFGEQSSLSNQHQT